jgi:tetratricopeptide (TPR) repeat protein
VAQSFCRLSHFAGISELDSEKEQRLPLQDSKTDKVRETAAMVIPVTMIMCFALSHRYPPVGYAGWLFAFLWLPDALFILPQALHVENRKFVYFCYSSAVIVDRLFALMPGNYYFSALPLHIFALASVTQSPTEQERLMVEAMRSCDRSMLRRTCYIGAIFGLIPLLYGQNRHADLEELLKKAITENSENVQLRERLTNVERQQLINWLAISLSRQAKYAEVESLLSEELPTTAKSTEAERSQRRLMRSLLVTSLTVQKKNVESEKLLQDEWKSLQENSEVDTIDQVAVFSALIGSLNAQKKYRQTVAHLEQAKLIANEGQSISPYKCGQMLCHLCKALGRLGPKYWKEAEVVGKQGVELIRQSPMEADPNLHLIELINSLAGLAEIYKWSCQWEEGIALLLRAQELTQKMAENNKSQWEIVASLRLGHIMLRANRLSEAESYFKFTHDAALRAKENKSVFEPFLCRAVVDQADIWLKQGFSEKAENWLNEYSSDLSQLDASSPIIPAKQLRLVARLHRLKGEFPEAESCLKQCIALLPDDNLDVNESRDAALTEYSSLLKELGRHSEAAEQERHLIANLDLAAAGGL